MPQLKVEKEDGHEALGTFEWWISRLMLDPLFFLISKLNYDCLFLFLISRDENFRMMDIKINA